VSLSLLLLTAVAFAGETAPCQAPVPTAALATRLDLVEASFASADEAAFQAALVEVERDLPCAAEVLPAGIVARVHRAVGLGAFFAVQPERSTRAFAAARHLEPDFRFAEKAAPPGGPLDKEYLAVDLASRATLESGAVANLVVDGQAGAVRARDWPAIVQVVGADGAALQTVYLWPSDPLPLLAAAPPAPPESDLIVPPAEPSADRKPARIALYSGAGVAIAGALASWAVAGGAARDYRDNSHSLDELETLRTQANTWTAVAWGAGAVALGSGVGAVLIARW
jgi:hypothetical protein